jgi:hypothetical protein
LNDGSGKTIYPGTIDRGFTVLVFLGEDCRRTERKWRYEKLSYEMKEIEGADFVVWARVKMSPSQASSRT